MRSVFLLVVLLASATARMEGQGLTLDTTRAGRIVFENDSVRVIVQREAEGYGEAYYARTGEWHLLLTSGSALRPDPALKSEGKQVRAPFTEARVLASADTAITVEMLAAAEGHFIRKSLTLRPESRTVHVVVQDSVPGVLELSYLLTTFSFVPDGKAYAAYRPLDFVWTPQLRPDSDDVIADHTFRSPAIMMQEGPMFAALIPDVERIQPWRTVQNSADLHVETAASPFLSYGALNWRTRSHVFYTHSDKMTTLLIDSKFTYGFTLYFTASARSRAGYQEIVRYHWRRNGRPMFRQGKTPQHEPFSSYIRKAWYEYLPAVALDTVYNGRDVTLLRQKRLAWSNKLPPAADNDCWFTVWFNSLRTAYGMYLHGDAVGDTALKRRAENVLTLALLAPQKEGLAPSIFYVDSAGGHWVGDHSWGGIQGGKMYSVFNNCWTGYWLLQWSDLLPGRREKIVGTARRLGDFLVKHQLPSGAIPSWFDPVTLRSIDTLGAANAETSGPALFLAELYARTRAKQYLASSEKAMQYIVDAVIPERKWFDFETFFSCARKKVDFFDPFTQQYPQNTLSIHQAAEACLSLHRVTGRQSYADLAVQLTDYLCLFQQVWSPGWLSRDLFGGFGAQNTDGEWSDARQGYFAVTLMNCYDLTGEPEYFERGVAALRAMFSLFESPTSPRTGENYSHSAIDRVEGVTGINWGTGSSVVSLHILRQRYGDAYIRVDGGWGAGIDGCTVTGVHIAGDTLRVAISDLVASPRLLRITFAGMQRDTYAIVVNGISLGTFTSSQMRKGVYGAV